MIDFTYCKVKRKLKHFYDINTGTTTTVAPTTPRPTRPQPTRPTTCHYSTYGCCNDGVTFAADYRKTNCNGKF